MVQTRTADEAVVIPSALSAENVAKAAEKAAAPAAAPETAPAPETPAAPSDKAAAPVPIPEGPAPEPAEAPASDDAPAAPSAEVQDELDKVFREIAEEKLAEIKNAEPAGEASPDEETAPVPEEPKESD